MKEKRQAGERNLPAAVDAERTILGAVLLDNSKFAEAETLTADFSLDSHRIVFAAITALLKRQEPADITNLTEELRAQNKLDTLDASGGVAFLHSLRDGIVQRPSIAHFVSRVKDSAARRRALCFAEALQRAVEDGDSLADIAQRLSDTGRALAAAAGPSNRITTVADIPDIFNLDIPPVQWAIEGIIPQREVTIISGAPGIGKTFLGMAMARAVLNESEFLNRSASRMPVLVLDRENGAAIVKARLETLFKGPMPELSYWGNWVPEPAPLLSDARLLDIAKTGTVMIFDSLVRFHEADENSASEMSAVTNRLRQLADAGATVIVLHHKGKSDVSEYRGSSDIAGGVDVVLAVNKRDELLELRTVKSRHEEINLAIRADFAAGTFELTESPQRAARRDRESELAALITAQPGINTRAIIKEMKGYGASKGEVLEMLRRGVGTVWRVEDGPQRSRLYHPLLQVNQ